MALALLCTQQAAVFSVALVVIISYCNFNLCNLLYKGPGKIVRQDVGVFMSTAAAGY